jgi:acetyl-CoA acetyltransferase
MSNSNGRWQDREVIAVEAPRTPIGRGHREKGWFRGVDPNELLGAACSAGIERAGIEPLGSSGARLLTTLVHELERSDGELGLATMCTAEGTGTGTLIQRI